jgi:hypothetical protein
MMGVALVVCIGLKLFDNVKGELASSRLSFSHIMEHGEVPFTCTGVMGLQDPLWFHEEGDRTSDGDILVMAKCIDGLLVDVTMGMVARM